VAGDAERDEHDSRGCACHCLSLELFFASEHWIEEAVFATQVLLGAKVLPLLYAYIALPLRP
jgi:hypothetical protein